MAEVFISYSRADHAFVGRLHAALEEKGYRCWVDWSDIPPAAEWMEEIRRAIDGCERFLCVVSRHSAASEVCLEEVAHAEDRGKSFVPVILQEIDPADLPAALQKPQWIRCLDDTNFPGAVQDVVTALDTDVELVHEQL